MAAAWTGSIEMINALVEQGADITKIDGNGFTAFQVALSEADISENYATTHNKFNWKGTQKMVLRKKLHSKDDKGLNVIKYELKG